MSDAQDFNNTIQTIPDQLQAILNSNHCHQQGSPVQQPLIHLQNNPTLHFLKQNQLGKIKAPLLPGNLIKQVETKFLQFNQFLKTKYTSRIKYISYNPTPEKEDDNTYRPLSQQTNKFQEIKKLDLSKFCSSSESKRQRQNISSNGWNIFSPFPSSYKNTIDDEQYLKYSRKWIKKRPRHKKQLDQVDNNTTIIILQSYTPPTYNIKNQKNAEIRKRNYSSRIEEKQNNKIMAQKDSKDNNNIQSSQISSKLKYKLQMIQKIFELRKATPRSVGFGEINSQNVNSGQDEKTLQTSLLSMRGEESTKRQKRMDEHQQKILNYKFIIQRKEWRGNNDYFKRISVFEQNAKININKKEVQMKSLKEKIKQLKEFQDLRSIENKLESQLKEIQVIEFKRKLQK